MIVTFNPYPKVSVSFDEEKHSFTIGERKILSVTRVTSVIDKSPVLMGWQEKITRNHLLERLQSGMPIDERFIKEATSLHRAEKEKAGTSGDIVHEYFEQLALKLKPEIPEEEEARNGVLAGLKWINENRVTFLEAEKLSYSKKYDFAGIIDSIARVNGKLTILDFKTSSGIYPEMFLQASAYATMYEEMTKKKIAQVLILHLDKKTGNFKPYPIENVKGCVDVFIAALKIRRYLNGK